MKVRNRRQKFLEVGQKLRSMRDRKRGLHDSRRRAEERRGGGIRKAQIVQIKESRRGKLM